MNSRRLIQPPITEDVMPRLPASSRGRIRFRIVSAGVGDDCFGSIATEQPAMPAIRCLLCTESDPIVARMRNDAKSQMRTRAPQQ
jgi:hypothetical protein